MMTLSKNLRLRLASSAIAGTVFIFATYLSSEGWFQPFFLVLFAGILGLALWEYGHLAKAKGFRPLTKLAIACSTLYVFSIYLKAIYTWAWSLPELIFVFTLAFCFLYYFFRGDNPLVNISITFFGLIYLTVPLCSILNINFTHHGYFHGDGRLWLIYLLAVTKLTDTGAYLFGKQLGAHKLAPIISPKKTWEGALGGVLFGTIASVVMCLLVAYLFPYPVWKLDLLSSILLGLSLSIVAQFGDLAESLLKRDAGLKDSNQLPGLGGALDVLDSLIFTSPLLSLYLRI